MGHEGHENKAGSKPGGFCYNGLGSLRSQGSILGRVVILSDLPFCMAFPGG